MQRRWRALNLFDMANPKPAPRKNYAIDATGKTLGRLASHVAQLLRGKSEVSFAPNVVPNVRVVVTNLSKIRWTGMKFERTIHKHYSGYPGGLKEAAIGTLWKKDAAKVFEHSVWRMLPKNKLRAHMRKNLTVTL